MALINIPVPQFPNVPIAPGVPAVLRDFANSQLTSIVAQVNDALGVQLFGVGDAWGLFSTTGGTIITADSVKSVEVEAEYTTSDYPVEEGAFESYNKVQKPKEFQITFLKGGRLGGRSDFLQSVDDACASLDLFTLSTPEIPYASVNPVRYSYKRTAAEGKTLLTVEVWVREVRVTVSAAYTNTAQPDGAANQNGGAVQPQTPSAAVTAAVAGPLAQIKGLF